MLCYYLLGNNIALNFEEVIWSSCTWIDPNVYTTYLETECFNLHQTSCHNDICAIDWPCSRHMHPFALTLYLLQKKLLKESEMCVMLNIWACERPWQHEDAQSLEVIGWWGLPLLSCFLISHACFPIANFSLIPFWQASRCSFSLNSCLISPMRLPDLSWFQKVNRLQVESDNH